METTLFTGDRLIVNRLPVTWAQLQNKQYIPERGHVIVFKNPKYNAGMGEEFIVKRVIAFPGERVTVKDGILTVYNDAHPDGFHPDDANHGEPGSPTSGDVDTTCAMVGGIVVLYTGVEGIPAEWIQAREPLPDWAFKEHTD